MWKYKLIGHVDIQGLASVIDEGATLYKDSSKLEAGADPVIDPQKGSKRYSCQESTRYMFDMILMKVMHEPTAYGM